MYSSEVRELTAAERFIYWITEREGIRLRRLGGDQPPWTGDEILQTYRFCNVVRVEDRVSQWLLKKWYLNYRDHPNMVLAAALARFINLPSSLTLIDQFIFTRKYDPEGLKACLRGIKANGSTIFNGAYMVRGNDGEDKIASVVDYYTSHLVSQPITPDTSSMEKTWAMLVPRYGFGSFMAGQVVADLRWALSGTWDDRRTWAPIGPGSRRGMNRFLGKPVKAQMSQAAFNDYLTALMEKCGPRLPAVLANRMEAHDWQNCLCEYDGYERVLWGEGRKKELYRGPDTKHRL